MSDDEKPVEPVSAPVVHTDTLWGGPRWIENVAPEPVYVETKEQYWALLAKYDKRMKGQQESDPGPHFDPKDIIKTGKDVPVDWIPRRPFNRREAETIYAVYPLLEKYGIKQAVYCTRCFSLNRESDRVRIIGTNKKIGAVCLCGTIAYEPPGGMTNEPSRRLANTSQTSDNIGSGLLMTPIGGKVVPTVSMEADEAGIIRDYATMMQSFDYEVRWFCGGCFDGSLDSNDSMGIRITPTSVALVCASGCRMLVYGSDSGQASSLVH